MRLILVLTSMAAAAALSGCSSAESAGSDATTSPSANPTPAACHKDTLPTLAPGVLTLATDDTVYQPWFINDDPSNGQGFESALAYAVAEKLGYTPQDVRWVRVPFNEAIAPGPKSFDANLAEISITEDRKQAVDFSSPYLDVTQAFLTLPSSPAAAVDTIDGLRDLQLGAQAGTTSFDAATAVSGDREVAAFDSNQAGAAALTDGQIDAFAMDLRTTFALQMELPDSVVVGQIPPVPGAAEQLGIVLAKDSPLTECVSEAVDDLGDDGVLFRLQKEWLAGPGSAPFLE